MAPSTSCSKNFPVRDIEYYIVPRPSRQLSKYRQYVDTYATALKPSQELPTSALVQIESIKNPLHPANNQRGLFARRQLDKGTFVVDYVGVVHLEEESDATSEYDICLETFLVETPTIEELDKEGRGDEIKVERISIDAQHGGNEARFVNDFRGVPGVQRANCEFRIREISGEDGKIYKRMSVVVVKKEGIKKGEELLVSYGKGFWKERNKDK